MGQTDKPIQKKSRKEKENPKKMRQSGKTYVSPWNGKTIDAKKATFVQCSCRFKCSDVLPFATRVEVNKQFWDLADWNTQSNFILSSVHTEIPKRCTVGDRLNSRIQNIRKFTLNHQRICQKVYLATLAISHSRLDYVLRKKNKFGISSPDRRGGTTWNKLPEQVRESIFNFLDQFPKYKSHYSFSKRTYFDSHLTIAKLHSLFTEEMEPKSLPTVSLSTFSKEFSKYDVGIYVPKSDTCNKCDEAAIKIKSTNDVNLLRQIEEGRNSHQERALLARKTLQNTTAAAKCDKSLLGISYDLQKTQPIPYLSTNKAYYARQLNLYNFGINILAENSGVMCTWHEGTGKRGSVEVCSALYEFLSKQDLTKIKKIHSFSDCCGGQNRNRNVISFKMFCCNEFGIDEWQHTYMETGHSFLPNDLNFAKIEQRKKREKNIYCYSSWIDVIKTSQIKNPFKTLEMSGKFLDINNLTIDRKFKNTSDTGEKFSYLDLKWFCVQRNSDIVKFKSSNNANEIEKQITFSRKSKLPMKLCPLSRSITISKEKEKDLKSLMAFIPAHHFGFYNSLNFETTTAISRDCDDD